MAKSDNILNRPKPTAAKPLRQQEQPKWFWIGAAIIFLVTLLSYIPAIRSGFIWDDDDMLTNNPLVKAPDWIHSIWLTGQFYDYYPLTLTSLWIEWRLWAMDATSYHVTNVLLHIITAITFWRVLKRLNIPGAWLAGLVFAIHPVNVESVAWITERKNTLSEVFYALALLCFLRFDQSPTSIGNSRFRWYGLALFSFLLALLSKTSVVMLPFVLLGCAWWQRRQITRRDILQSVPFFGLSTALGLLTVWFQYHKAIGTDVVLTSSFWERLAGAGWAVWFYLYKALLPLQLSFVYSRWTVDAHSFISYLPGVLVVLSLGLFWWYRRTWGRPLLFGFGYFVVTLFPVIGFFKIYFMKYSLVADHWQYPSIIGIIALVVAGLWRATETIAARLTMASSSSPSSSIFSPTHIPTYTLTLALGLSLSILTWGQCSIYHDDETLFHDTLAKNPSCWMAYHNLAAARLERWKHSEGDRDAKLLSEAFDYDTKALQFNPDHAGAHYDLGFILIMQGKVAQGLPHLRDAVRVQPDMLPALDSLGWVLATYENPRLRNGKEAVQYAKTAVSITEEKDPKFLDTLAVAYAETGQFQDALATAQKAMNLAMATGQRDLASEIQAQLPLFRAGRPYREH
ncbi:MAG: Tetratricopeptide repeat protein [Pedosphaera sp.]|nr:Tetratricopeptide repeat protein [Pedosphaera sp.]